MGGFAGTILDNCVILNIINTNVYKEKKLLKFFSGIYVMLTEIDIWNCSMHNVNV